MTDQYRGPRNQRLPCPSCESQRTHIYESRSSVGEEGVGRRRRYVCKDCQTKFSTVELMLLDPSAWGGLVDQLSAQILDNCSDQALVKALERRLAKHREANHDKHGN